MQGFQGLLRLCLLIIDFFVGFIHGLQKMSEQYLRLGLGAVRLGDVQDRGNWVDRRENLNFLGRQITFVKSHLIDFGAVHEA